MTHIASIALAGVVALAAAAGAQPEPAATPSPKPTLHPRTTATARALRTAVNLCDSAAFYTWADEGGVPTRANVPPAQNGERLQIQAGPRFTLGAHSYLETTIPEPPGLGGNGYYWVSTVCFNLT
jgi:hypothetical protein